MPAKRTSSDLESLEALSATAKDHLRTGTPPDPELLKRGIKKIQHLDPPQKCPHQRDQARILEIIRRFAALADLAGDYRLSRSLIEPYVEWAKTHLYEVKGSDDPYWIAQLIWYLIVYSFVEHRAGHFEIARDTVKLTLFALNILVPSGSYPELRHRAYYALGRHCQNLRTSKDWKEAEHYYTAAIDHGVTIALDPDNDKSYALYRVGLTMVGLGRIFRDRGELDRAFRQMSVARLLLKFMPQDEQNNAYADYLLGSILRQQGRLKEAIELLLRAFNVFVRIQHYRYSVRCRHELAKAYFNAGRYDTAETTLTDINKVSSNTFFATSEQSRVEWLANDTILIARIVCERARVELLRRNQRCLSQTLGDGDTTLLEGLKRQRTNVERAIDSLAGIHAPDVKARGLIVRSEINLVLGESGQVEGYLRPITSEELTPIDPAEGGWAWLVVAEARLNHGDITGSLEAVSRYRNFPQPIENKLHSDRANTLEREASSVLTTLGLWLRGDEPVQKYTVYERCLQQWLLLQLKDVPKSEWPEILGKASNTLRGWPDYPRS